MTLSAGTLRKVGAALATVSTVTATHCRIILLLQLIKKCINPEVPSARFCTREFFFNNYNIGRVRCKRFPPEQIQSTATTETREPSVTHSAPHTSVNTDVHLPPRSIRRTCQKMLNDCLHCAARSLPGEIDQTHNIRNEMACHTELFSVSRCSEGARKITHSTSAPEIGVLTTGVTMDMCCRWGTCHNPGCETDDDQSPDVCAERSPCGPSSDL